MVYTPNFFTGEFHRPTGHYQIQMNGQNILYAYIRKNGCTAFKNILNSRTHPRFKLKSAIGLERNPKEHIQGNMKYYRIRNPRSICLSRYDHVLFVYRDPAARFISLFVNKFVEMNGAQDLARSYETRTGNLFESATMIKFMEYASHDFVDLDVHLWPQKSHLESIPYTTPVRLDGIQSTMSKIIGPNCAQRWFGKKTNTSQESEDATFEDLTAVPAKKLRSFTGKAGGIGKKNFLTNDLLTFVEKRYDVDYDMIAWLENMEHVK